MLTVSTPAARHAAVAVLLLVIAYGSMAAGLGMAAGFVMRDELVVAAGLLGGTAVLFQLIVRGAYDALDAAVVARRGPRRA